MWIALGPIGVVAPILIALLFAKTEDLKVREFLPRVAKDDFDRWEWLQNFYLYSAQFLINTAFVASLLLLPLAITLKSFWLGVGIWLFAGVMVLLAVRTWT